MKRRSVIIAFLALVLSCPAAFAQQPAQGGKGKGQNGPNWVGSWAASQQIPEPRNALAPAELTDATVRQIVHLSLGGKTLRVHISNAFGTAPLEFTSVHIALPVADDSPKIEASRDHALDFSGRPAVTIPAGAEYISDPINFAVEPDSSLAITFHLAQPPAQETSHPGSRATSYLVHGDHAADADLAGATKFEHWFNIAGVDVEAPAGARSIVALGDSITDGHGATTNGNDRWPDDLARRLLAASLERSVLNQGIGGNRLLHDGLGPNALARFDRDVLAQPGVRYVIVLEGINDIGTFGLQGESPKSAHDDLVARIIGAYQQIVLRAHAHGIRVFGSTVTPFVGSGYYHPGSLGEGDREAVNAWIRAPGHFDAVIDFDKTLRDPADPHHLLPAYDSGDHLHPSPAGYGAMANAIRLSLFAR
jgi:lysophospholipase L1-like esterase